MIMTKDGSNHNQINCLVLKGIQCNTKSL